MKKQFLAWPLLLASCAGGGYSYYWGSAWSKGSVPADWEGYLADFRRCANHPLLVTIK